MHYLGTNYSSVISGNRIAATWTMIVRINTMAVVKDVSVLPHEDRGWLAFAQVHRSKA